MTPSRRHVPDATDAADAERPVLGPELAALRHVLDRLIAEMKDLEQLARHVPRVSSVAIQAERTRHQIGGRDDDAMRALLRSVLTDMEDVLDETASPEPS